MGTSKKQKKREWLRYRDFVLSPYGVIKIKSLGYTCIHRVAPLIARASGPLGTNAQYLFALEEALKKHGMADECLTALAQRVRELQEQAKQAHPQQGDWWGV